MGYDTKFKGFFKITPTLKPEHKAYLEKFAQTRRMKMRPDGASEPDPVRKAVGLSYGSEGAHYVDNEGAYYVGNPGSFGQDHTPFVLDYNTPPTGQPGLWCQWTPNSDGTALVWDGGEKFYHYKEWLDYLIKQFLKPWGYTLNGEVEFQGEEPTDKGTIFVKNNVVECVS